jgi:Flp pilus assembly protein TadG
MRRTRPSWLTWRGRSRDEKGAIAVIVAIMAVLLFASAAIAVDLGNLWSRKRDVQKQVDVTALSVGWMLPMTTSNKGDIADAVAAYFTKNPTIGQDGGVTGSKLLNGSDADGEVTFQNSDGTDCVTECTRMTVLAPQAKVAFFLGRVADSDGAEVQRQATVEVMGELPPGFDMLPFWLPSGCALGSAEADTTQGGGGASGPSPTPTSTESPTGSPSDPPIVTPEFAIGTHDITGPDPLSVASGSSLTISSYHIAGLTNHVDRASIRFYSPDGTFYVEYAAMDLKKPEAVLDVPAFQVSSEVTDTPGDWRVYALVRQQGNNNITISANSLVFRVGSGSSPDPTPTPTATDTASASPPQGGSIPVGCVGQDRGNFGQLDSPRRNLGSGQTNKRLAINIAEGLDHQLVPFTFAPSQPVTKECGKTSSGFIDGAEPDNIAIDGRNCILGDTGNDGPAIYDGLVGGVDGFAGRLSTSRPGNTTTCPGRSDLAINGHGTNNDVLSCFLRNGATLDDLAQSTGVTQSMLDPSVVDSPRFVWLPVVYANDRAQKNFQPIKEFVAAFITDETQTAAASADNGLEINGNSVSVLTIFCFNKEALPLDAQSPTTTYGPQLKSTVRLVD